MKDINTITEREVLESFFGSSAYPKEITDAFEIKKRSIGDESKAKEFLSELKTGGFTVKKKSYSDFVSIMGVKRKSNANAENDDESCHIIYLDKNNGFKKTEKSFVSFAEAMAWGRENIEKFNSDMINAGKGNSMENGGSVEANDIILDTYKGYDIVNSNGVIEVVGGDKSLQTRFIVDLDDSKLTGARKSAGMSIDEQEQAAYNYIDWITGVRAEKKYGVHPNKAKITDYIDFTQGGIYGKNKTDFRVAYLYRRNLEGSSTPEYRFTLSFWQPNATGKDLIFKTRAEAQEHLAHQKVIAEKSGQQFMAFYETEFLKLAKGGGIGYQPVCEMEFIENPVSKTSSMFSDQIGRAHV